MRNIIEQSVHLPASAERLFEMYLDPAAHSAFTGSPVTVSRECGAEFSAFEGQLSGSMLTVIPSRLIVQSWRSVNFDAADPDSTLILAFADDADGGRVDLIHLDVPEGDFDGVSAGWPKFYWKPWRKHLEAQHQ